MADGDGVPALVCACGPRALKGRRGWEGIPLKGKACQPQKEQQPQTPGPASMRGSAWLLLPQQAHPQAHPQASPEVGVLGLQLELCDRKGHDLALGGGARLQHRGHEQEGRGHESSLGVPRVLFSLQAPAAGPSPLHKNMHMSSAHPPASGRCAL